MKILVLNAGSSTQKSCLYEILNALPDTPPKPLWEAKIDWMQDAAMLSVTTQQGTSLEEQILGGERQEGIGRMLATLYQGETQVLSDLQEIDAVGHRIVHGGEKYREAVRVTPEVVEAIASLIPLAPEHNPVNLEGIDAISKVLPDVMQVAVFDTAFHATLPPAAAVYPIPYSFYEQGIRRYGFHGINHQYCRDRVAALQNRLPHRLITCHLGNGASLAAIRDGTCIDTTMGFTPLEGLMMGSRSGSIDPGILIHLLRQGYDVERLNRLLNKESGLKGLSGVGNDLRQINRAIASGSDRAQLALEVYLHSLQRHIGAMLVSLGGLDTLVFTGGVGENSPLVRRSACQALEFLGLQLNEAENEARPIDRDIASAESPVRVFVIRAREDWAIAQECWKINDE
ncbi:acetate kinase [Oscillatoria sp. FACHB-1406]|uniref:acetate/propionate family kinase n=1 Tax=Oscillatoria sp. FACHB-1406 TaxID=2692846 RepID=UPI001686F20F|nr:acetate kinase [Oscillatoria sp. FACHB-1406]MBD2578243.1 acetate kinase [Oscillatoria sp. FACHB-1406]